MYSYLALGDSYTIGELVPSNENFPHQLVEMLKHDGVKVSEPIIIATTGWTTDELAAAIMERAISGTFSIVTLLIGVNNQYRGRSAENYTAEFESLLNQAIAFAGGHTNRVFVLSIPDWGATPFAEGKDRKQIAHEIDVYNGINQKMTAHYKCHYLDITDSTRINAGNPAYLVSDALHPSGKEYKVWAERLSKQVKAELGA